MNRRQFLKLSAAAGAATLVPWKLGQVGGGSSGVRSAMAAPLIPGLSDPALQPKFEELAPNALHPSFLFDPSNVNKGKYKVIVDQGAQQTGLVDGVGNKLWTPVWGYGRNGRGVDWPGRTFEVQKDQEIEVTWENKLPRRGPHLLPVDTSLHWAYSLHGYENYSIEENGVPIVTHLHGGHSDAIYDGNPEYFFSPGWQVRGPRWVEKKYRYQNDQPAGNLWYHDHALGITRLNVYAGLAGFYFVRDEFDTGTLIQNSPDDLGLPKYPYELAYAIQDRMFYDDGRLFYPAFPNDPAWDDFIPEDYDGPVPSALAEFFGDHMVVNGKIWPKHDVEPRNYRMRLLNGCDSRFLVIRFRQAATSDAITLDGAGSPINFTVIGSDQGLGTPDDNVNTLVIEPGGRYDIVFDFKNLQNQRIIMENIGGDEPFGGLIPGTQVFSETDRIMAFDVADIANVNDGFSAGAIGSYGGNTETPEVDRRVALFEGTDEYGRLQPLLGTVTGLGAGSYATAYTWFQPTTETPGDGDTEIWEIYNFTGDAHPVHLHLVNFEILDRQDITFDSDDGDPGQPVEQHNGTFGNVATITNINKTGPVSTSLPGYFENAPKDMVTALPDQVTRIKATFDKTGRYVWHCHILSHEDHEMMRVLQVG